ncbi:prefoldin subunit alpha [Candidatus Woesearchaeota archaeon]|nr:prefoldin subunit alpha [Candidatus Woesearchaeota archaeon]
MGDGNTERLKEKQMELHVHEQKLQQIQQYLSALEQQIAELQQTAEAVGEIAQLKPGASSFVPISSGIFVKASLDHASEFLVNVGAHTAVTKSKDEVLSLITSQMGDIKEMQQKLAETFLQLRGAAERVQQEMSRISPG